MRRRALLVLVVIALGVAACEMDDPGPEGQGSQRPNVLVIVTDDQRSRGTLEAMPATRRLFEAEGVLYANAFATTPTCCPARASLFSGRYAHNHGVLTSEDGQFRKLDQDTTIQRYLSEDGYTTAIFGKFLNDWGLRTPPYFDRYALPEAEGADTGVYRGGEWIVDGQVRVVRRYATDFIAGLAIDFIEEAEAQENRPWFLVLSVPAPHIPYLPARRHEEAAVDPLRVDAAMREEDRTDKPPYVSEKNVSVDEIREVHAAQLKTLMSVDDLVDDVFVALEDNDESTLSFFLSDNGYMWAEHGVNGKRYPYTSSVEIPFLMRWPGRLEPRRAEELVGIIDIAPTVLEVAGVSPEHEFDGWSLLGDHKRDRILLEYWSRARRPDADWSSLRTHSYQYIETYDGDRSNPAFFEFYDLMNDPHQLENRYAQEDTSGLPDRSDLSSRLAADARCEGTSPPDGCP